MKTHRNSQKRIEVDDGVFAITTVTKDRYPYFREKIFCEVFIEQLRLCKKIRGFRLYGFCLMPDHLHIILQPKDGDTISKVMHYLKKHTSRNINITMGYTTDPREKQNYVHSEGEDGYPRQRTICHGENVHSRLRLCNIDQRFIDNARFRSEFLSKYHLSHPHPKFAWQSSFHDHLIRDDRDLRNQLGYLWINPEKDGVVSDYTEYTYSSYEFHRDLIDS